MVKSRLTEQQVDYAEKQAQLRTGVGEVCWKLGIWDATLYSRRKEFGGLGPSEPKRLRLPEADNHVAAAIDLFSAEALRERFSGSNFSARQTQLLAFVLGGRTLVLWVSQAHAQHAIDKAALGSSYTYVAGFSVAQYSQPIGGSGMHAKLPVINPECLKRLEMAGRLGYWHGRRNGESEIPVTVLVLSRIVQHQTITRSPMARKRPGIDPRVHVDVDTQTELTFDAAG